MVKRCIVLECSTTSRFPTHHFPKDPVMFQKWRTAVESSRTVNSTDDELKKRPVCHLHFREDDYHMDFKTRRLKSFAVPSLNIPTSNIQQAPVSSHVTAECIEVIPDSVPECDVPEEIPECLVTTSQTKITPSVVLQNLVGNGKPMPSKNIRKRIRFPHIKAINITPQNTKFMNAVLMLKKKQKKMQRQIVSYRRKLQLAENSKQQNQFQKMFSSLTPVQQNFIGRQLRLLTVSPKGRRFTRDEKILAHSIYKQSPKQYKWLSVLFSLPSVKTLNK